MIQGRGGGRRRHRVWGKLCIQLPEAWDLLEDAGGWGLGHWQGAGVGEATEGRPCPSLLPDRPPHGRSMFVLAASWGPALSPSAVTGRRRLVGHRGCCVQGVFGAAVLTQSRAHRPTPYTHACTHAHAHLQPKSELMSWDEEESQKDRSGGPWRGVLK